MVTIRTCSLPVRRPSRTTRLRRRARPSRRGLRARVREPPALGTLLRSHAVSPSARHQSQRDRARQVAALGRQQAVLDRRHVVAAGRRMEAADQLRALAVAVFAKRVLELVAVAPRLERGHDLLQLEAVEVADAPQRVVDLGALDLELALVRDHLPRHAGVRRGRRDPLGARLEHLQRARVRVAALALVHDRAHAVAGDRAGDEHDVAAVAESRDALAAERERVDRQLQLVAALRARRALRPRGSLDAHADATSSSSSAFCAWRRFSA